ncbi:elongation factor 1-beta [Candidatus Pacearchaeota archaeon]|nr:elongation factor 1-beta [Candidatus Pacearchaeota archaeon]
MGTMLIKIKLMPSGAETNLDDLKTKVQPIVEAAEGKKITFEEEPIAFGLKALIVGFDLDEKSELEVIENKLTELDEVTSAEVADMRRAFG